MQGWDAHAHSDRETSAFGQKAHAHARNPVLSPLPGVFLRFCMLESCALAERRRWTEGKSQRTTAYMPLVVLRYTSVV